MAKSLSISDLQERITLLQAVTETDDELNRVETLRDVATVWANVEPKNSVYDTTATGERAEVRYKVTMRKNDIVFDYVRWRNVVYNLLVPKYDVERKYTVFEMVGKIYG